MVNDEQLILHFLTCEFLFIQKTGLVCRFLIIPSLTGVSFIDTQFLCIHIFRIHI